MINSVRFEKRLLGKGVLVNGLEFEVFEVTKAAGRICLENNKPRSKLSLGFIIA